MNLVLYTTILFIVSVLANAAENNQKLNILFISSLGKDLPAQIQMENGLNKEIAYLEIKNNLYFEFFNTQTDQLDDSLLSEYLQKKYYPIEFDYLIGWGGQTISFLQNNSELFSPTKRLYIEPPEQLVDSEFLTGQELLIGTLEDYVSSLQEVMRLEDPKQILVIGQSTNQGSEMRLDRFNEAINAVAPAVQIEYMLDQTLKETTTKLEDINSKETIAFYLLMFSDGEGTEMTPYSAVQELAYNSNVPIYSYWESLLGSGIVGGYMMSQEVIGQYVGEIILSNDYIPGQVQFSPMRYTYDANALKKWDISQEQLPIESIIINQPPNIVELYKWHILSATVVTIFLLLFLSFFLVITVKHRNLALTELSNERKNLKEKVKARTLLLSLIAENIPNSYLMVIYKDMKIRFTSGREFRKQGLDPDHFTGMFISDLFEGYEADMLETIERNFQKVFLGEEVTFELFVNNQYQVYHVVPFIEENGRVVQILSVAENITEQKKLESQLRQSQKTESIGRLAGGIAHEFNNLLTPMLGYTEMLLSKKSKDDIDRKSLNQIQLAGERASKLVKQILAYGRQSISLKEPMQLETLAEEAIDLLKKSIPPNISIIKELEKSIPPIMGMPSEIHQVILNLCINASHAMPEGGEIKITVKKAGYQNFTNTEKKSRETSFINLAIQDSGVGMDQATIERIFDPFYTTKSIGGGSGLGLSVVQGIIEQHDGHIEVKSVLGKGTTFHVYFPVTQEEVKVPMVKTESLCQGTERILLIDDELMITSMTKSMLETLGYKVTDFLDSTEALKRFTDYPQDFDLVITDYGMKKMNGKQVAINIKKISPDTPIILITGYGDLVAKENIGSWGINDLLMKPFAIKDLSEIVRKLLNNS